MFREVAVVQDAIFAIMAVEASMNSSNRFLCLGGNGNGAGDDCLLADFPVKPYKAFESFGRAVIASIGLEGRVRLDETEVEAINSEDCVLWVGGEGGGGGSGGGGSGSSGGGSSGCGANSRAHNGLGK